MGQIWGLITGEGNRGNGRGGGGGRWALRWDFTAVCPEHVYLFGVVEVV